MMAEDLANDRKEKKWFLFTNEELKIARFLFEDFQQMDKEEQMDKFLKIVQHLDPMFKVSMSIAIDMTIKEKKQS